MIEQLFKPNKEKLNIQDVEIDLRNQPPETADRKLANTSKQPTVYYYNQEIPAPSINKLIIDSNTFMPTLYMSFIDTLDVMDTTGFPGDNATITVVLPSNNGILANIFMVFKIQKYEFALKTSGGTKQIYLWGICNVDDILITEYKAYPKTNSFNLFKTMSEVSGLGYKSNIQSSSDEMTWINPGMHNYTFLQEVIKKSWISDTSFMWSYIDLEYNLNYIDVEKQLNENIDDIIWFSSNVMNDNTKQENIVEMKPVLTNFDNNKGNDTYFTGEKVLNQSTDISLNNGYLRNVHFYDIDGNWKDKSGSYKNYALDTITTPGSESSTVYLKGDPGNTEFYNKNKTQHYVGKIDTINVYPDYLWAKVQNIENIKDLQKISMRITLPIPNFNLKRFEKVSLVIGKNAQKLDEKNNINLKLSGDWLVTGISYEWNGSVLFQYANLIKRELSSL